MNCICEVELSLDCYYYLQWYLLLLLKCLFNTVCLLFKGLEFHSLVLFNSVIQLIFSAVVLAYVAFGPVLIYQLFHSFCLFLVFFILYVIWFYSAIHVFIFVFGHYWKIHKSCAFFFHDMFGNLTRVTVTMYRVEVLCTISLKTSLVCHCYLAKDITVAFFYNYMSSK